MRSKIQRAAATWLLPVTVLVLSPMIIKKLMKRSRLKTNQIDEIRTLNEKSIQEPRSSTVN
jgi:hypothetical protein